MTTGLFAAYRHQHRFRPVEGGSHSGLEMTDQVSWTSPLGPLGTVADWLFVRRTLD